MVVEGGRAIEEKERREKRTMERERERERINKQGIINNTLIIILALISVFF